MIERRVLAHHHQMPPTRDHFSSTHKKTVSQFKIHTFQSLTRVPDSSGKTLKVSLFLLEGEKRRRRRRRWSRRKKNAWNSFFFFSFFIFFFGNGSRSNWNMRGVWLYLKRDTLLLFNSTTHPRKEQHTTRHAKENERKSRGLSLFAFPLPLCVTRRAFVRRFIDDRTAHSTKSQHESLETFECEIQLKFPINALTPLSLQLRWVFCGNIFSKKRLKSGGMIAKGLMCMLKTLLMPAFAHTHRLRCAPFVFIGNWCS